MDTRPKGAQPRCTDTEPELAHLASASWAVFGRTALNSCQPTKDRAQYRALLSGEAMNCW